MLDALEAKIDAITNSDDYKDLASQEELIIEAEKLQLEVEAAEKKLR